MIRCSTLTLILFSTSTSTSISTAPASAPASASQQRSHSIATAFTSSLGTYQSISAASQRRLLTSIFSPKSIFSLCFNWKMRWLPALALAELAELALAAPAPKPAGDGSGLLFGDITPTAVALVQAVKSSDPLFVDDTDVTPTPVVPVQAAESPAAFIADIANGASTAAAPAQVVQSPPAFVVEITDDTPTPVAQAQAAESSGPLLVDITDVTATAVDPAGSTPTRAPIPDHEILVIRPPTGGSANEDCGDGKPIFFNQDTWWAFGMNGRINDFWSKGIQDRFVDAVWPRKLTAF